MSDLGEQLRAQGKRLTSQRQRVLRAVSVLGHATPDEIVAAVADDGGASMSASTVYRSVDALSELGLLAHTHVDARVPSYHLAEHATHIHVVCRVCGWVGDADAALAADFVARLEGELGFVADITHTAVWGRCAACRDVPEGAPHRHGVFAGAPRRAHEVDAATTSLEVQP